jgi:methylthioribose-1-phosphate isomerase
MTMIEAVRWSADGSAVDIIDQRRLPNELVRCELRTVTDICEAISTLAVRGAPAIGVAGAMGLVVATLGYTALPRTAFLDIVRKTADRIAAVRPTAVNLPWAMARMKRVALMVPGTALDVHQAMRREASAILDEDRAMCRTIGEHSLPLLARARRVLTHCNAGALATGGMGTALAGVYLAHEQGHTLHVYSDETRPLLQGSRLTAWELSQAGIPVTVIADNMAASVMRTVGVDLVIVGADRIAANGDVANKIGTYGLAIAARHHGIPFYVAAPWSTVDPNTATGADIHIEHRAADEMRTMLGVGTAPAAVDVFNPAFDVTPAELVTAVITDRGVFRAPYAFAERHSMAHAG